MMREIDHQLSDGPPTHIIVPVGVGSLAEAVVNYWKAYGKKTKIIAVEPATAACLYESLSRGASMAIETKHTIMTGMNCGTVSNNAWAILQAGIDASLMISDEQAHRALVYLQQQGIKAGPCGAAPLAALWYLQEISKYGVQFTKSDVVVLLCTEGTRTY